MENHGELKLSGKTLIMPVISIFIFTILIFSAGYAYFTVGSASMGSTQINVGMPSRTTLSCSGTPTSTCSFTLTVAQMKQSANSNSTAAASKDCYLNCTCSGSTGGKCNYNINLQAVTAYTPSSGIGSAKEYTVTAVMGTGCSAKNTSTTETQVSTQAGKILATCNLTAGQASNSKFTFKWYNLNLNQDSHSGQTYRYKVNSLDAVLT